MASLQCHSCGSEVKEGMKFCPQCGGSLAVVERADTLEVKKSKPKVRLIALAIMAVVFIGGLSIYWGVAFREFHPVIKNQPSVVVAINYGVQEKIPSTQIEATMDQGFITIPLQKVMDLKLVRFYDPEAKQMLPLIAYITPEGKLVTAMSKSEVCQSEDFYLEGHNIHCASCPSYWNMSSLEAYACCQRYYPDPIPSVIVGNEVRIDAERVRHWRPRG
jgi:uncharacterized membrane protein